MDQQLTELCCCIALSNFNGHFHFVFFFSAMESCHLWNQVLLNTFSPLNNELYCLTILWSCHALTSFSHLVINSEVSMSPADGLVAG